MRKGQGKLYNLAGPKAKFNVGPLVQKAEKVLLTASKYETFLLWSLSQHVMVILYLLNNVILSREKF